MPVSSPAGLALQRVDFYVLESSDSRERLKVACQEVERAFLAEERVLVWFDDAQELALFDDLLWTFADRSFVPHEPISTESSWDESPVLLSAGLQPAPPAVLCNLAKEVPPGVSGTQRVIEIIDADPVRRQAGRARFKQYRDLGIEPTTHKLAVAK